MVVIGCYWARLSHANPVQKTYVARLRGLRLELTLNLSPGPPIVTTGEERLQK